MELRYSAGFDSHTRLLKLRKRWGGRGQKGKLEHRKISRSESTSLIISPLYAIASIPTKRTRDVFFEEIFSRFCFHNCRGAIRHFRATCERPISRPHHSIWHQYDVCCEF